MICSASTNITKHVDTSQLINRISLILFPHFSGLNVKQLMASIREGPATRFIIRSIMGAGHSDRPINGENDLNPVTRYNENAF